MRARKHRLSSVDNSRLRLNALVLQHPCEPYGQLLNRIVLVKSPIFQALKFKNDPKFYFTKDRMFTGKEG